MTKSIVAITKGEDKFKLLDEAAEQAGFWEDLSTVFQKSQKRMGEFLIAIKPNLMMFMSRAAPTTITEPVLVEHLIQRLRERGFTNVAVVESQNTMSNWLCNRSVNNVARVAGYSGAGYKIVDLTLEKTPYTYTAHGLPDWQNWVGRTWRDADYRIDFAKFKTQIDNNFTLCLKNEFGTLPLANKYWHYHTRLPYWACTYYIFTNFQVHFGFVDAFQASDGTAGFAVQYNPKTLQMMLAGKDLVAIDVVGASLMQVDPWESPIARFVMQHQGEPDYSVIGDTSPIQNWSNVPATIQNMTDVAQALYVFVNVVAAAGILNIDTVEFPSRFPLVRWYYKVMNWLFAVLNGNGLTHQQHQHVHRVVRYETRKQRELSAQGR